MKASSGYCILRAFSRSALSFCVWLVKESKALNECVGKVCNEKNSDDDGEY